MQRVPTVSRGYAPWEDDAAFSQASQCLLQLFMGLEGQVLIYTRLFQQIAPMIEGACTSEPGKRPNLSGAGF